jgi:hypothetical protein
VSADNGIYILETGTGPSREYRVKHLQAVEDLMWDEGIGDYSENADIHIENARKMWADCTVITSRREAFQEAQKLFDEIMQDDFCPIVEYGIQTIPVPRDF